MVDALVKLSGARAIRPGHGLPSKHLRDFLGRTARAKIARGTLLD
jgi:hypothetical protein